MTSAVTPGRVTSAGATPETRSIAGRGRASSGLEVCAREHHEAFVLGAVLRGGYRPSETIVLGGMAEATVGWRWGVTGPEGRDGFETDDAVGIMASGDCRAGLQIHMGDVAVFLRRDCDDRAFVVMIMSFHADLGLCAGNKGTIELDHAP
ncbi:MAG: hypothetical protein KF682_17605 [Nitrospira sp.]|nr:hypothetical protein [Nitrospira sp.]